MFITSMSSDELLDGVHWTHSTISPDWHDVQVAIERLDGTLSTMVTLGTENDHHMAVLGGNSGYVVYATFDWCRFHTLVQPGRSGEEVVRFAGQQKRFPSRVVMDREAVVKAVLAFAQHGVLDDSLQWESDA